MATELSTGSTVFHLLHSSRLKGKLQALRQEALFSYPTHEPEGDLGPPGDLPADDVISLDHRSHSHTWFALFHATFDTDNFPLRSNEHIRTIGDFCWQGQRNIQIGTCLHVLINDEKQTSRGDVSRLTLLASYNFFSCEPDAHRQRQIITSRGT